MPTGLEFSTKSPDFLCSDREINFSRINILSHFLGFTMCIYTKSFKFLLGSYFF